MMSSVENVKVIPDADTIRIESDLRDFYLFFEWSVVGVEWDDASMVSIDEINNIHIFSPHHKFQYIDLFSIQCHTESVRREF